MGHNRPRRSTALFGVITAMAFSSAAVVVIGGGPAGAASISGAITNVTISPTNPAPNGQLTTDLSWCVPNGTAAGDTFTLTLPPQLRGLPAGFQLADGTPAHNVVANAVISNTTPAVATFTMTAAAAAEQNVCGDAFFTSGFDIVQAPSGVTTPFTSTTNDGRTFTTNITPTGSGTDLHPTAEKFGLFPSASDQGHTMTADVLNWVIQLPVGPLTAGHMTDTLPAGDLVDCSSVTFEIGDPTGSGGTVVNLAPYTGASNVQCSGTSPSTVSADFGAIAAGKVVQMVFSMNLTTPTGAGSQVTFTNTASVTSTSAAGTMTTTPSASLTQSSGGGSGSGDGISIAKYSSADGATNGAFDTAPGKTVTTSTPTPITMTITNSGTNALTTVVVSDATSSGPALTGLSCAFPDGTAGMTWAGPFAVGASFDCTGTVPGLSAGVQETDTATVTAAGNGPVTASNPFNAHTPPAVSVGDFVFLDTNRDGIQNAGDSPLPGIVLTLTGPTGQPVTDINGNPVSTTTTAADGSYHFTNLPVLPAGQHYTVTATPPAGFVATTPNAPGSTTSNDSSSGSATSGDLTANGDSDDSLDFGFVRPRVSVGDFVWLDRNHNGVQDTGEPGIPGVTVSITDTAGNPVTDVDGNPVGPVQTDANGMYEFSNLPPGRYVTHIEYSTAPAGYVPTLTGQGTPGTDSSTASAISTTLLGGQSDQSLDYGLWIPAPSITVTKSDAAGNAADTSAAAVTLANGGTGLVYTITNNGDEALKGVTVTDQVVTGGTVSGLTCTFPDRSTGTTWAGPFAAGASFTCTATLSGVPAGVTHEDIGTATGIGLQSGTTVAASNPYYASRPASPATTTSDGGSGTSAGVTTVDTGTARSRPFSRALEATGLGLLGVALMAGSGLLLILRHRRAT